MLKRFSVSNFKGFEDKVVLDFTAGNYEFNKELVKDKLVNKALLIGDSGKTNLGMAIFDIQKQLQPSTWNGPKKFSTNFVNLNNLDKPVEFDYVFQFGKDEVEYKYTKKNADEVLSEEIAFNGKVVAKQNYVLTTLWINELVFGKLNPKTKKYALMYRLYLSTSNELIVKLYEFASKMYWYSGKLDNEKMYRDILALIYKNEETKNFQEFLNKFDKNYELVSDDKKVCIAYNDTIEDFANVASDEELILTSLYYLYKTHFNNMSFLVFDNLGSQFSYKISEKVVEWLNKEKFQTLLITNYTGLITNNLTRPDCCYILSNGSVRSLDKSTDKELRKAHNLEKMYKAGTFEAD